MHQRHTIKGQPIVFSKTKWNPSIFLWLTIFYGVTYFAPSFVFDRLRLCGLLFAYSTRTIQFYGIKSRLYAIVDYKYVLVYGLLIFSSVN